MSSYLDYKPDQTPGGWRKILYLNWPLAFLLAAVASAGFLMLYSVSGGRPHMWAEPQIERFVVGMIAMIALAFTPIWFWRSISVVAYGEAFGFLCAHYQPFFGEDHGRHASDAHFLPALFQRTDGGGVALVVQHVFRFGAVEACLFDGGEQNFAVGDILAAAEIGVEEGEFERCLLLRVFRPVQELVGVEAVVDALVWRAVERDAERAGDGVHVAAAGGGLFAGGAVFAGDMFRDVFAFGSHLRVQLERMPADVGLKAGDFERLFELAVADQAPGADDVGDDVYLDGHGFAPLIENGAYSR